jgi:hypothetical protein
MAVTIKSSGPRGAKTYEVRVDGQLYHYTDTLAAARRSAAEARASQRQKGKRKNPTKAQKRAKPRKSSVSRRVSAALAKYLKSNPKKAKGKSVRLTNFTGTVTKLRTGQVKIQGRKRTIRKRK